MVSTPLRRAALIALAAIIAQSAGAQSKAYSLDDLTGLLKRKVASTRVLQLAKQNCINFTMNSQAESSIKRSGGTSDLVAGLYDVCGPAHPRAAVDSATRVTAGAVPIPKASATPVDSSVPVLIHAAVVTPDLNVRALPQLDMLLITPHGDTMRISTDLDGKYSRNLNPGQYRIESVVTIGQTRYHWAFFAQVGRDMGPIELTQKNATVENLAPAPPRDTARVAVAPPPKPLTEREIFEHDRSGLFTVYGIERGTGFLVDSGGLVMTNAHLLDYAEEVRVLVDSVTKVYARIVGRDKDRDAAILAINPKRCTKCVVLQFPDSAHAAQPGPGDRVIAFGSPFNKLGVLSLGIVSNADANTVVSDVSIGNLNTGGPLVNKDGLVVGLNSDHMLADAGGSRVSNSVAAPALSPLLSKTRDSLRALILKPVSDELLPIAPREPFPTAPIMAVSKLGKGFNIDVYQAEGGPFKIFMMTPQVAAWRQQQAINALADKKQDDPKRYATLTKIDPIQAWQDWDDVLADRRAVILFNVFSEDTEYPFYQPDKIQNFKEGSFRDMKIFRDGVEIIPIEKVRVSGVLNVEQMRAAGKTIPWQGIYLYRVSDFAPRAVGTVATYTVTITDAITNKQTNVTLKGAMIEQMWKDFTAYQYGGRQ